MMGAGARHFRRGRREGERGGGERGANGGGGDGGDGGDGEVSLLSPPPRSGVDANPRGSVDSLPSAPREFAQCGPCRCLCRPPRLDWSWFPRSCPSAFCPRMQPQLLLLTFSDVLCQEIVIPMC